MLGFFFACYFSFLLIFIIMNLYNFFLRNLKVFLNSARRNWEYKRIFLFASLFYWFFGLNGLRKTVQILEVDVNKFLLFLWMVNGARYGSDMVSFFFAGRWFVWFLFADWWNLELCDWKIFIKTPYTITRCYSLRGLVSEILWNITWSANLGFFDYFEGPQSNCGGSTI